MSTVSAARPPSVTHDQIEEAEQLAERFCLKLPQGGAKRLAVLIKHVKTCTAPPVKHIDIPDNWDGWRVG